MGVRVPTRPRIPFAISCPSQAVMIIMTYALRPGLSFCFVEDRVVFLDLVADRYFRLTADAEASFVRLQKIETRGEDDDIERLKFARIIVEAPAHQPILACSPPPGIEELHADGSSARATRVLGALASIQAARCELRVVGLARTITSVQRRKRIIMSAPQVSPLSCALPVAAAFEGSARALSAYGLCLPWSIALARQLLSAGVIPRLILGVRLSPFKAHAWVQVGPLVINEQIETTCTFTPILAV